MKSFEKIDIDNGLYIFMEWIFLADFCKSSTAGVVLLCSFTLFYFLLLPHSCVCSRCTVLFIVIWYRRILVSSLIGSYRCWLLQIFIPHFQLGLFSDIGDMRINFFFFCISWTIIFRTCVFVHF